MSTTPAPQPPTNETPPPAPNIARIIAIGIGVIVLGGLVIAWLFNRSEEPSATPTPTVTTGTQSQSPTPTTPSATSTPSPTASATTTPSPTPPPLPPDAIMQVDIANGYLPNVLAHGDWDFWNGPVTDTSPDIGVPIFHKMPAENVEPTKWFAMKDGRSVQVHPEAHLAADGTAATTILAPEPGSEANFGPVFNAERSAGYHDLNGDGYLDAIIMANCGDATCWYLAIFDPEDPDHPYVTHLWASQFERTSLSDDGTLTLASEGCVSARASILGADPEFTRWERTVFGGPTQCLAAN